MQADSVGKLLEDVVVVVAPAEPPQRDFLVSAVCARVNATVERRVIKRIRCKNNGAALRVDNEVYVFGQCRRGERNPVKELRNIY